MTQYNIVITEAIKQAIPSDKYWAWYIAGEAGIVEYTNRILKKLRVLYHASVHAQYSIDNFEFLMSSSKWPHTFSLISHWATVNLSYKLLSLRSKLSFCGYWLLIVFISWEYTVGFQSTLCWVVKYAKRVLKKFSSSSLNLARHWPPESVEPHNVGIHVVDVVSVGRIAIWCPFFRIRTLCLKLMTFNLTLIINTVKPNNLYKKWLGL